ncbi:MAG: ABC transporter permease [Schleiferiaceae bacterium]|nr:ABC transporter permease [Schleiferiaceae bacterium]
MAALGYAITPDKTKDANAMHLPLAAKKPGFSIDILYIPLVLTDYESRWSYFGKDLQFEEIPISEYRIENDQLVYTPYVGEGVEGLEKRVFLKHLGPALFKTEDYIKHKTFWLGTDRYGRDLLSRLILGTRISLAVGLISVFISLLIGIPLGTLAGFYKGKVDAAIMWVINVIWSIPTLLMVIALTLVLGKGFWQVFVAVGLTMWVEVARVVRGQVLSIREKEYVDAARVLGYSDLRIMWKHILPNAISPVIVISAANFASAILIESGLSFLGIGAQPPTPSWGSMIRDHYSYIILGKPYLALLPGLCIMLLVLAFMMIGNKLRDVLDVRTNS